MRVNGPTEEDNKAITENTIVEFRKEDHLYGGDEEAVLQGGNQGRD